VFKHQELDDPRRLVLYCQVQVGFTELLKSVVDVLCALFLVQLVYFNKLIWLVVLDKLNTNKSCFYLLSTTRAESAYRQASTLASSIQSR